LNGIDVSGGSTTFRQILTTSDVYLAEFLTTFFGVKIISRKSSESYKNMLVMSGKIPLDEYRNYIQADESFDYNKLREHIAIYNKDISEKDSKFTPRASHLCLQTKWETFILYLWYKIQAEMIFCVKT